MHDDKTMVLRRVTVYRTRTRRVYNAINRVRAHVAKMMRALDASPGSQFLMQVSENMGERLEGYGRWLWRKAEQVHQWVYRLRAAHKYNAGHRRKFFASDTVKAKLKWEREVEYTAATPPEQRVYKSSVWEKSTAWSNDDWRAGIIRDMENADLIMSGAEGPLRR